MDLEGTLSNLIHHGTGFLLASVVPPPTGGSQVGTDCGEREHNGQEDEHQESTAQEHGAQGGEPITIQRGFIGHRSSAVLATRGLVARKIRWILIPRKLHAARSTATPTSVAGSPSDSRTPTRRTSIHVAMPNSKLPGPRVPSRRLVCLASKRFFINLYAPVASEPPIVSASSRQPTSFRLHRRVIHVRAPNRNN